MNMYKYKRNKNIRKNTFAKTYKHEINALFFFWSILKIYILYA